MRFHERLKRLEASRRPQVVWVDDSELLASDPVAIELRARSQSICQQMEQVYIAALNEDGDEQRALQQMFDHDALRALKSVAVDLQHRLQELRGG